MPGSFMACNFIILKFRLLGTRESHIGVNLNTISDKAKRKYMITAKITPSKWPSGVAG